MSLCCSKQCIIETDDEMLCQNCGTVHGQTMTDRTGNPWEEFNNERYSPEKVKRRLTKFDYRMWRTNLWATRGRMHPNLFKILELLLMKLQLPESKRDIIKEDAVAIYLKLISNKQGYGNKNSFIYWGAIVYHLLKIYGIKRPWKEFVHLINNLLQIHSFTRVRTGRIMYRILAYIRETYPNSNTNVNLESQKSLINKEIMRIGNKLDISKSKLIPITNLVLNISDKYFESRSPTNLAAAFIANELSSMKKPIRCEEIMNQADIRGYNTLYYTRDYLKKIVETL